MQVSTDIEDTSTGLADLFSVCRAVPKTPVLRRDWFIHPIQARARCMYTCIFSMLHSALPALPHRRRESSTDLLLVALSRTAFEARPLSKRRRPKLRTHRQFSCGAIMEDQTVMWRCGLQIVEAKEAGAAGVLGVIASVSTAGAPVLSSFTAAIGLDAPVEVPHPRFTHAVNQAYAVHQAQEGHAFVSKEPNHRRAHLSSSVSMLCSLATLAAGTLDKLVRQVAHSALRAGT